VFRAGARPTRLLTLATQRVTSSASAGSWSGRGVPARVVRKSASASASSCPVMAAIASSTVTRPASRSVGISADRSREQHVSEEVVTGLACACPVVVGEVGGDEQSRCHLDPFEAPLAGAVRVVLLGGAHRQIARGALDEEVVVHELVEALGVDVDVG